MSEIREQLEEFALHIKPGTTKGNHRIATFDTVELAKLVKSLILLKQIKKLKRVDPYIHPEFRKLYEEEYLEIQTQLEKSEK